MNAETEIESTPSVALAVVEPRRESVIAYKPAVVSRGEVIKGEFDHNPADEDVELEDEFYVKDVRDNLAKVIRKPSEEELNLTKSIEVLISKLLLDQKNSILPFISGVRFRIKQFESQDLSSNLNNLDRFVNKLAEFLDVDNELKKQRINKLTEAIQANYYICNKDGSSAFINKILDLIS